IVGHSISAWRMVVFVLSHLLGLAESLRDRKSTRLNSSHSQISYAVFCLKTTKMLPPAASPIGSRRIRRRRLTPPSTVCWHFLNKQRSPPQTPPFPPRAPFPI